ncbi:g6f-like [Centroberyx gerrardi]
MESGFLTFNLVSALVALFTHFGTSIKESDWDDLVVTTVDKPTTLVCVDKAVKGGVAINWMMKSLGEDEWKLVLSANERKEFSGGASKASMRLTDTNFQDTGNFSLLFLPKMEDQGLYSCLIMQQERKLREKIILLAILTVAIVPTAPIPQDSILRLIASVKPDFAIARITWAAPGGAPIMSERMRNTRTVAKLPRVQTSDSGAYVCTVYPRGNSSNTHFNFSVDVTVDDDKVAIFANITHGPKICTAIPAQTSFPLSCPTLRGDYVLLYWQPPDKRKHSMKRLYQYDRWRDLPLLSEQGQKLRLAGPPYSPQTGSFSFVLTPEIKDGGLYICEVFLNDSAFSQRTLLSVLKVKSNRSSKKLELWCQYSERSQIRRAGWTYQNQSRRLQCSSHSPGIITTTLPLPITPDMAGNYTCTLQLNNGQTVWATHTVTLPLERGRDESVGVTTPSLLPSLSALLLLVPLVAAAVGVLLWRQGHISGRGIEQSLSHYSGEAENIYENPEDIRQTPPQGSVYMDLKPRGEDDVYKELERYEQCQA